MVYHILNGDALRMQLEGQLKDPLYVCRECLVDGPVVANDLASFFSMREDFLMEAYGVSKEEFQAALAEFQKIGAIPDNSVLYLWFEEDLFCQLNFWFLIDLLKKQDLKLYLVMPKPSSPYSFANMTIDELQDALENARILTELDLGAFRSLWKAYQQKDFEALSNRGVQSAESFPFVKLATEAAIDLAKGEIWKDLEKMINEVVNPKFGLVFQKFSSKYAYLGMGDLQLRRNYNQILNSKH